MRLYNYKKLLLKKKQKIGMTKPSKGTSKARVKRASDKITLLSANVNVAV